MATNPYLEFLKSGNKNITEAVNTATKMLGIKKYVDTKVVQAPMFNKAGEGVFGMSGLVGKWVDSGGKKTLHEFPGIGKTFHRIQIATDATPGTIPEEAIHAAQREAGYLRTADKISKKSKPVYESIVKKLNLPKEFAEPYIEKQLSDIMDSWSHRGMKQARQQLLSENPKWVGEGGIFPYAGRAYNVPEIPQVQEAMLNRPGGSPRFGGENMSSLGSKLPINAAMWVAPMIPWALNYMTTPKEERPGFIESLYQMGGIPMSKPEDFMT